VLPHRARVQQSGQIPRTSVVSAGAATGGRPGRAWLCAASVLSPAVTSLLVVAAAAAVVVVVVGGGAATAQVAAWAASASIGTACPHTLHVSIKASSSSSSSSSVRLLLLLLLLLLLPPARERLVWAGDVGTGPMFGSVGDARLEGRLGVVGLGAEANSALPRTLPSSERSVVAYNGLPGKANAESSLAALRTLSARSRCPIQRMSE
jgi:hypothetical protein